MEDFLIPAILGKNIDNIDKAIHTWEKVRGHRMAKAGIGRAGNVALDLFITLLYQEIFLQVKDTTKKILLNRSSK